MSETVVTPGLTITEQRKLGREFCKDYEPRWPISQWNGICKMNAFRNRHHPCVPFVKRCVCLSGHNDLKELDLGAELVPIGSVQDHPTASEQMDRDYFPGGVFRYGSVNPEGLIKLISTLQKAAFKANFRIQVSHDERNGMTTVFYVGASSDKKMTILYAREEKKGYVTVGYNKRFYGEKRC